MLAIVLLPTQSLNKPKNSIGRKSVSLGKGMEEKHKWLNVSDLNNFHHFL